MLKKLHIVALILAAFFLITEAGKGLHFLVFHIAPIHNENCHHHCSPSDEEAEDERCVFSKIQYFMVAISEPPQCCKPFIYAESIIFAIFNVIYYRPIIHYFLRGPPSGLRYSDTRFLD